MYMKILFSLQIAFFLSFRNEFGDHRILRGYEFEPGIAKARRRDGENERAIDREGQRHERDTQRTRHGAMRGRDG